jgi:O-methyltransferase involved in polyketide biosynthesis
VQESLFLTLCGRALDSRAEHSILGDTTADDIAREIGRDPATFPLATSSMRDVALRAKKLDEIVRRFVARHPDAVVLDLGAGLDSRMIRVDPPSTVDWYDIDLPEVIAARAQLLPQPANAHAVAVDLTDPHCLDEIPTDRPAVIVADGLLAFLTEDGFISLLNRLTSHFPSGELAFNGYTRFHVWVLKRYSGTRSIADVVVNPGFDDPREPERWDPALTLIEEILLTRAPEIAQYPLAIRLFTRLSALSTWWSRRGTTVLRYRF